MDRILTRAGAPDPAPRPLDETELDPIHDGWTVRLWNATADLFCCRYFHRAEGSRDSMGRMRPSHIRHCVIGSVADQAATKVMAGHFTATVRRLARQHAAGSKGAAALRRSFEAGCAARLAERLRAHAESTGPFCAAPGAGPPPPLDQSFGSGPPKMPEEAAEAARRSDAALEALEPSLSRARKRARRTNAEIAAEAAGLEAADGISLVVRIGEGGGRRKAPVSAQQTAFGF